MEDERKASTMNDFRDQIVLAIIKDFGFSIQPQVVAEDFTIMHGSAPNPKQGPR